MKKYLLVATAALFVASPALAQEASAPQISGARVEAHLGYDYGNGGWFEDEGALYGVGLGYDFALSNRSALGAKVGIEDSTISGAGRDLYVGARFTQSVGERTALYGKAGYSNARYYGINYDGVRVGLGVTQNLGGNTYAGAEYRYTNYNDALDTDRHQAVAVVGVRF